MQTTSVNNKFDMYLSAQKNVSSLTTQIVFKILVSLFIHLTQGVEYDSLSIPRIDYKYNQVAHDAQATQLKQCGSQILKH